MQRDRNNLYIFSTSRASLGSIISCRSEITDGVIGRNIFSHLGIPSTEQNVFRSRYQDSDCFVLMNRANKRRGAVAFFKPFGYGISLVAAVEFDLSAGTVLAGVREVYSDAVISEACLQIAERRSLDALDAESVEIVSDTAKAFASMSAMSETGGVCNFRLLERVLEQSSRLFGVDVAYGNREVGVEYKETKTGMIFDGASFASVLAIMMMVSRTYSVDRALRVLVGEEAGSALVELSLASERNAGWESVLQTLFKKIETYHNHIFDCSYHKGRVRLIFSPYYEDIGVTGVKRRDVLLRYYPEDTKEDPVEVINFLAY